MIEWMKLIFLLVFMFGFVWLLRRRSVIDQKSASDKNTENKVEK